MKPFSKLNFFLVVLLLVAFSTGVNAQVITNVYINSNDNLTKILTKDNKRYIIKENFDLRGKEVMVGANSILDFQGGCVSNGKVHGNRTLIIAAPYTIFDRIELTGSFAGESYPEWFNGDAQKCIDHFKIIKFVNDEYTFNKPLNLKFGCKLQGSSYNVLKFRLPSAFREKGCINVAAYCEVSDFIIYVESDNPAIEIKSGYVGSSLANSDYMQQIAPNTTSPGAGASATIHVHDLTLRTALAEKYSSYMSSVISTSPAIWLVGGGGYASYDRDAHMYRITKSSGMWGIKFDNIDISGRWKIGIKCEQVRESISTEEISKLEKLANSHESKYNYWDSHNQNILKNLKKDHTWDYDWITGCVFDNIKIHSVNGGIWLGREHTTDGKSMSRGFSLQHFTFSNVQMQYWQRTNADKSVNIGSKYFVKLNYCNGITFTNCEPWDWPMKTKGIEKPFQIDDSYNVWNIVFQGYSIWPSTTTNFVQYENGSNFPMCNEHRVVASIPESSFGMGNVAVLDDYIDYTNYKPSNAASMKANKQLRLLPPGTYSMPNLNKKILKEFFKIDLGTGWPGSKVLSDSWLDVKLITNPNGTVGTQYRRIITINIFSEGKMLRRTMNSGEPVDRILNTSDWIDEKLDY